MNETESGDFSSCSVNNNYRTLMRLIQTQGTDPLLRREPHRENIPEYIKVCFRRSPFDVREANRCGEVPVIVV